MKGKRFTQGYPPGKRDGDISSIAGLSAPEVKRAWYTQQKYLKCSGATRGRAYPHVADSYG